VLQTATISSSTFSSRKLSCTGTVPLLLHRRWWITLETRRCESTQERVNDSARVKQLGNRARSRCCTAGDMIGRCVGRWPLVVQIRPGRRNQRSRPIGQYQHHLESAPPMCPPEHLQRFALEGVVLTEDGYALRIPIEVVMGSVSCLPSTPWIMDGW
jgi:hypothetical protein